MARFKPNAPRSAANPYGIDLSRGVSGGVGADTSKYAAPGGVAEQQFLEKQTLAPKDSDEKKNSKVTLVDKWNLINEGLTKTLAFASAVEKFNTQYGGKTLSGGQSYYAQKELANLKKLENEAMAEQKKYEQNKKLQEVYSALNQNIVNSIVPLPRTDSKVSYLDKRSIVVPQKPTLPSDKGYVGVQNKPGIDPKLLPEKIDVGVSSKTRYVKLKEDSDIYVPENGGLQKTYNELAKEQVGFEQSASMAVVTPEDILTFTPGISGKFFGGVVSLGTKAFGATAKVVAPNVVKLLEKSLAEKAGLALSKSRFVTSPQTIARVEGEKIFTTTAFRVRIGKYLPKEFEVVSKGVTTVDELSKQVSQSFAQIKATPKVSSLVEDVSKSRINLSGKELIISSTQKQGLGKEVTDLLVPSGSLQRFGVGFKGKSSKVVQEAIGDILFTKTSGVVYVKPVSLVERLGEKLLPVEGKSFKESIKVIEGRVIGSKKTATSLLDTEQVTSVLPRELKSGNVSKVFNTTTLGKKLYNVGIGAPESKVTALDKYVRSFEKESKIKSIKSDFGVSGVKGKTISGQYFKDESVLVSPVQRYKTLDIALKGKRGDVVLSKVKVGKYPTQFVYTEPLPKDILKGYGKGFEKPTEFKKINSFETKLLNEPQKRLMKNKTLLLTGETSTLPKDFIPSDAFIEKILSKTPRIVSGLPKNIIQSSGGAVQKLSSTQIVSALQKTSSGVALLVKQALKLETKTESGLSKVTDSFMSSGRFREALRNQYDNQSKEFKGFNNQPRNISLPKVGLESITLPKNRLNELYGRSQYFGVKIIELTKPSKSISEKSNYSDLIKNSSVQNFKLKQPEIESYKFGNILKQKTGYKYAEVYPQLTRTQTKIETSTIQPNLPLSTSPINFRKRTKDTKSLNNSKLVKAFTLVGKKRGKLLELGKGLTLGEALSKGKQFAFGGAQRTIALKQEGITYERKSPPISIEAFRTPSLKSKLSSLGDIVLIQKSKYAISSAAEKREITFAGLQARRQKPMF